MCGQVRPCSACLLSHNPSFPLRYDFYLISQMACRGTVNPTYYNVIYDDNGLKPDHMQRLTFKLCHVYYNWMVSDSHVLSCRAELGVPTWKLSPDSPLAQCLNFHKGWMSEWMDGWMISQSTLHETHSIIDIKYQ